MSDLNHQPTPDRLDQVVKALRDKPVPTGPPAQLITSTIEAIQTQIQPSNEVQTSNRRRRIMRAIQFSAAGITLAVLAGIFWLGQSSAAAFHKAMENAEKAKTLTYDLQQKINGRVMPTKMYMRETQFRIEIVNPGGGEPAPKELPVLVAFVFDTKNNAGMQINYTNKTYIKEVAPKDAFGVNLVDQFRELKKKEAEEIGTEKIGDMDTKIYKVKNPDLLGIKIGKDSKMTFRVWIDTKTNLPAKIQITDEHLELVFENLQWNTKLDDKLFSNDVPEGFTVKE